MTENFATETIKYYKLEKSEGHTLSYKLGVFLVVYTFLYYYLELFARTAGDKLMQSVPIAIDIVFSAYLFCKLFVNRANDVLSVRNKRFFMTFIVCILISYFVTLSGFEKMIGLVCILLSIMTFNRYPMKKEEKKRLFLFFIIAVAGILLNGAPAKRNEETKFNSNGCGFLLTMVFFVSTVLFAKKTDVRYGALSAICLALQFVYDSRTSFFGCLVVALLFVVLRANKKTFKRKSAFRLIFLVSVLGVLVAYIYSGPLYSRFGAENIRILNKNLFSGREVIWSFTFDSIRENFFFGVGSKLNEDKLNAGYYELIMNAHNQPLAVLASFGIFVFIVFYVLYSSVLSTVYKKNRMFLYNRMPAVYILTMSFMSYFDIYLFAPLNWLPILLVYALILNNSRMIRRSHPKKERRRRRHG